MRRWKLGWPGVRRPGGKQCGEGTGAVGGHLVWPVSVATASQGTQVRRGMGPWDKQNMTIIGYTCQSIKKS